MTTQLAILRIIENLISFLVIVTETLARNNSLTVISFLHERNDCNAS